MNLNPYKIFPLCLVLLAACEQAVPPIPDPAPIVLAPQAVTRTYTSTGSEQTFTVPDGITSITVVAVGAAGGDGDGIGGRGAVVTANLAVTPNSTLYVNVGGNGAGAGAGYNGGGFSRYGSGGGGASDVRTVSAANPNSLQSRLLVAAGGGGAGEGADCSSGDGGGSGGDAGSAGGAGGACPDGTPGGTGGGAGTQTQGGVGGSPNGQAGSLGQGGSGGAYPFGDTHYSNGGGGGGGLYGGGGGGTNNDDSDNYPSGRGGGGGGSSLVPDGGSVTLDDTRTPQITITYTAPNTPPIAQNDLYTTEQGIPLTVSAPGVLANDTDPDGNPLSAALVGGPTSGTLALNPDGSFTYTPNAGYSGTDSFTYKANDGAADSNVATVSLTVTPPADTTAPIITLTTPADGAVYKLKQTVNAAYSCTDGDGSGVKTCTGNVPSGSAIDTSSVGSGTFTVTATDNAGNESTKTVSYKVVYDFKGFFYPVKNAPALNPYRAGSVVPFSFTLGGNYGRNVVTKAVSVPISCSTLRPSGSSSGESTGLATQADTSSRLSAQATTVYLYLWGTQRAYKNTCRQITLTLNDTTDHQANFRFK